MSQRRVHVDLSSPRNNKFQFSYDHEAFGRFAEGIARFIGTARFLVYQTFVCAVWIVWNLFAPEHMRFDTWGRGFVLLTLVLSLQAAYAAPLILLAQNRQSDRDRIIGERDRGTALMTQAETEFVARELASIRIALSDVVTNDEIERAIERGVKAALEQLRLTD